MTTSPVSPLARDAMQKRFEVLLPAVEWALQFAAPGSVTAAFLRLLQDHQSTLAPGKIGEITVNDKRLVWHGTPGRLLRIKLTSHQLDLAVSNRLVPLIVHGAGAPPAKPHPGNVGMTDYIARSADQLPNLLGIFSYGSSVSSTERSPVAPRGTFGRGLEALLGRPSTLRPFVCHGLPQSCEVFIVGINATTGTDFWSFWDDTASFNYASWEAAYLEARHQKGKHRVSPTRAMINWIRQALPGVPILETNVYAVPTARARELTGAGRDTTVFTYLLQTIRPKVILAHGKETAKVVDALVQRTELRAQVISTEHLCFWGRQRARMLADQIQVALGRPSE